MSPPRRPIITLEATAGLLLGLTSLLFLHRYAGIAHDSILYMGEAMAQVHPDVFSRDLFFLHGSQSSYSLFPWLLGKLLHLLPAPDLFMWGSLTGLLLFAAASWYTLFGLFPERQRYWALLAVLCLPSIYGIVHIFSYDEAFLTSRPLAEAFCLFAIGLLSRPCKTPHRHT